MGSALGNFPARDHGGRWADIRDFGASPSATPSANRIAIQAAIDSLNVPAQGLYGTVYFPSGVYNIDRPVFMDAPYIGLLGENGSIKMSSGMDAVVCGIRRQFNGVGISADHFVDLYTGGAGGSPLLDSSAVTAAGQKWGYRTLKDHHIVSQGGAIDTGYKRDFYAQTRQLTVDLAIDLTNATSNPSFPQQACLLGLYEMGDPKPWSIVFANGTFYFQFRTADPSNVFSGGVNRSIGFGGSFLTNPGFLRVTVQVDLATATVAAWINGVQQTLSLALGANWNAAANLMFVSNEHTPFGLGSNSGAASTIADLWGSATDITFCGLKVSAELIYNVATTGSAQTRIDAATITDNNRYFTVTSKLIGLLPLTDAPPVIQPDRVVKVIGSSNLTTCAYFLDNQGHGTPFANVNVGSIRGMNIQTGGTAVLSGWTGGLAILDSVLIGGVHGFGSINMGANYPLTMRNCYLSGSDSPIYLYFTAYVSLSDLMIAGTHRCTFRFFRTNPVIRHSFVINGGGTPEYLVQSVEGGFDLDHVFWDGEGYGGGTKAGFYASASADNAIDGMVNIVNSSAGNVYPGSSLIVLEDLRTEDGKDYFPATFHAENVQIYEGPYRSIVRTNGTRWRGDFAAAADIQRPIWIENTGPGADGAISARHNNFTGPPRDGTWQRNSNVIEAQNPSEGQYTKWLCSATGSYGTATPPTWRGFAPYDDGQSLAAYIADHSYWSATGAPAGSVGFWSNGAQSLGLNALFGGTALVAPGTLLAGLGVLRATRFLISSSEVQAGTGYARVALPGNPFSISSGGAVTNTQTITFPAATGSWTDANGSTTVRALLLFNAAGKHLASVEVAPLVVTTGVAPTFNPGAISLAPAGSSGQGSFATRVHDLLNNFWLSGAAFTVPSIYLALSTAPASVGSAPSEPSGSSYARVSTTSASWAKSTPTGYVSPGAPGTACVIKNAVSLAFPAPTEGWGTVQSIYLMDAPSGGNVLAAANLTIPRTINAGEPARAFAPGALWICRS